MAATGDADAETAIKIIKQANKKREKYGNQLTSYRSRINGSVNYRRQRI
jgi:hypothetical protein